MTTTNWQQRAQQLTFDITDVIDGREVAAAGSAAIKKYSPRDGSLQYQFNSGAFATADAAVMAARQAYTDGRWSMLPVGQRQQILLKLADLVAAQQDEFALLECLDVGKPISQALSIDIPSCIATLRYFAEAADKLYGKAYADGAGPNLSLQTRGPVGVVAGIIGWNFPLLLATMKLAPALAMGNTVVIKPSELTSLSARKLALLALEAGVPAGVFNIVHGSGETVGAALARHPEVDLLTFTGSTATGKAMQVAAGQSNMKRLMLECGGKSPYIVFDDCPDDLDFVAQHIVDCAFQNQGEVCSAGTRLLIQHSLKAPLLQRIVALAQQRLPGDPLDPASYFGALISAPHLNKVQGVIDRAVAEGATQLCGETTAPEGLGGYYLSPVIVDHAEVSSAIAQQEIFGPVLSVFSFETEAQAIAMANATDFGLAAYLCTTDLGRAMRVGQAVEAGHVTIVANSSPQAGGVALGGEAYKASGFGCEGGEEGLASYSVLRSTHILV